MTEELPIAIFVTSKLTQEFKKLSYITNKLEAQLNFQTMTAGWYGDEKNILYTTLHLLTPGEFSGQLSQFNKKNIQHHADDVFSMFNADENKLDCFIALTDKELEIIRQKEKIIAALIPSKLTKVLNILAEQQQLHQI